MSDHSHFAMYTIYRNPADYPGAYVVRRHLIHRGRGEPMPDPEPWAICPDLEAARESLPEDAVVRFPRDTTDLPSIVETWR